VNVYDQLRKNVAKVVDEAKSEGVSIAILLTYF